MGAILTVEPGFEAEFRAYLDDRETAAYGYHLQQIDVFSLDGAPVEPPVQAYIHPVGRAPGWVGPLALEDVAARMVAAANPLHSVAYTFSLAVNIGKLARSADERDEYLDALSDVLFDAINV